MTLTITAVAVLPLHLQAQKNDEWKDENVAIEEDAGGAESGVPSDLVSGADAERFIQLAGDLRKNRHSFGGSYARVPARGWMNDRYEGFARNSFMIGDSYRLGVNLSYEQSNTFRDKNFPDRLYNAAGGLILSGDRFFVYAGAANRSDRLFRGLNDITLSAAALGTVYRSGPHGVVIGGVFSLRGELWKFPAPLPVIAYRYANKTFVIFAGFPFFMAWRPNKWFSLTLTGYLPGVGRAVFTFKVTDIFTIALDYAHRKDTYHLNNIPFHDLDLDHLTRRFRDLAGMNDSGQRFVLETNETGVRFSVRPAREVTLYAHAGLRFRSSYYFTKNILAIPSNRDWIANSLLFKAGANFLFHSGGGE